MSVRGRRLLLGSLVVVALAVISELAALPLSRLLTGHSRSRAEIQDSLQASPPGGLDVEPEADPEWMQDHVLHPFLGFVRNPRAASQRFNGRVVDVPVNDHGFFGPTPAIGPENGSAVVALIGGSAALDLYLRAGGLLADALGDRFAGREVRPVCLALGGMKQPQQLLAVDYFLSLGYRFDLIVNLDGFNEVSLPLSENVPFGVHPAYPRSWRIYASRSLDLDAAVRLGEVFRRRARVERWRRRIGSSPLRQSNTVLAAWEIFRSRQEGREKAAEAHIRAGLEEKGADAYQESGPAYQGTSRSELLRDGVALWKRSSVQLARTCEANGIEYHHVLQPNQHLAGSKPLTAWERRFALGRPGSPHVRAVVEGYPLLREAGAELARAGVAFHDLTQIFRDETQTLYDDFCCHFNQRGNEIVAEAIAARILAGP